MWEQVTKRVFISLKFSKVEDQIAGRSEIIKLNQIQIRAS